MASFAEEKRLRAHIELIAEAGDYAAYFSQGTNSDGDPSAWFITNDSDITAAEVLLDAKIAELSDIGSETANGTGPSNFEGYTPIHFDDSVSDVDYRAWFIDANGDYFKADNGNSDTLEQITDADETATLISDSGYVVE
tara:strand:- start:108 stop:524 length:417 start_codon:yes stop_codon:yes gene_type:complete